MFETNTINIVLIVALTIVTTMIGLWIYNAGLWVMERIRESGRKEEAVVEEEQQQPRKQINGQRRR